MSHFVFSRLFGIQKASLILGVLSLFIAGCAETPKTAQSPSRGLQSAVQPSDAQQAAPSAAQTLSQPPEPALAKRIETVITERLVVRSEPDKKSRVVAELRKGQKVEVKEQQKQGWVKIVVPEGSEGWVYGGSLTGFPELTRQKQAPSGQKRASQKNANTQSVTKGGSKPPVSDALDSEIAAGKKAAKPDDSVVDQPTKRIVDDSKVTGQNP